MSDESTPRPKEHQQTFLVIDDYGTGGIWFYLHARSVEEIHERFPELTVITQWRDWMTPDRLVPVIWNCQAYDIEQPHGWFAEYVERYGAR